MFTLVIWRFVDVNCCTSGLHSVLNTRIVLAWLIAVSVVVVVGTSIPFV